MTGDAPLFARGIVIHSNVAANDILARVNMGFPGEKRSSRNSKLPEINTLGKMMDRLHAMRRAFSNIRLKLVKSGW